MAKTKESTRRYDWHSRDGRKELDADVKGRLAKEGASRGEIAAALHVDPLDDAAMRAIGASLARGVRDGWADPVGLGPRTRYHRPPMQRGAGR